jgi:hypothetical protein
MPFGVVSISHPVGFLPSTRTKMKEIYEIIRDRRNLFPKKKGTYVCKAAPKI